MDECVATGLYPFRVSSISFSVAVAISCKQTHKKTILTWQSCSTSLLWVFPVSRIARIQTLNSFSQQILAASTTPRKAQSTVKGKPSRHLFESVDEVYALKTLTTLLCFTDLLANKSFWRHKVKLWTARAWKGWRHGLRILKIVALKVVVRNPSQFFNPSDCSCMVCYHLFSVPKFNTTNHSLTKSILDSSRRQFMSTFFSARDIRCNNVTPRYKSSARREEEMWKNIGLVGNLRFCRYLTLTEVMTCFSFEIRVFLYVLCMPMPYLRGYSD